MNHKTALIIFWTLVGITITSWGITFYAVESGMYEGDYDPNVDSFERNLARTLTITDLFFIPMIIMILLLKNPLPISRSLPQDETSMS